MLTEYEPRIFAQLTKKMQTERNPAIFSGWRFEALVGVRKMRRLTQGHDRLDLTADMQLREDGAAASRRPLVSTTALVYRPFLPIEDLVATLDHIASRKIDA